jgi:hypothetical protein
MIASHWKPTPSLASVNFDDVKDIQAQGAFRTLRTILLTDQSWMLQGGAGECLMQLRAAADTFNKITNVPESWKPNGEHHARQ